MPIAAGLGGPALPVDEAGVPLGTAENPLIVDGVMVGASGALGAVGDEAPTDAILVGGRDINGNLQAAQIRDDIPAVDDKGIVTRDIPFSPSATGPLTQTSTNAVVVVADSDLDANLYATVSYTMIVATEDVIISVWAANAEDFSDEVRIALATVVAGSNDYWTDTAAFRYYRIKIVDAVDGDHGDVTINGIAKR